MVDDWTALTAVLHDLKSTGRAFEIEDMLDIPRESGYRAIHLQLFEDGGLSAEIQIQPRELREAQEQVHDAYSKWRRRDDLTPAAFEEASRVGAESQAIFTKAWQKFTDRAGPRPDADAKIPVGLAADAADGELSALTRNVNDVLDDLESSFEEWRDFIQPRLDRAKMIDEISGRVMSESPLDF